MLICIYRKDRKTDMKNKNYRESRMKKTLREMKDKGVKSVLWSLSRNQLEYVNQFYRVEPELYRIPTKNFSKALCSKYSILKALRNEKAFKKHDYLVTRLKKSEKSVLDEFDIRYSVLKYRIYLA